MKIAAIIVDTWKLPIFTRVLDREDFQYTQHSGITKATVLLKVEVNTFSLSDAVSILKPFVEEANSEAARSKMN